MKESRELRRCKVMNTLKGEQEDLGADAIFNCQPVELLEDQGVVPQGWCPGDDVGGGVLNRLQVISCFHD